MLFAGIAFISFNWNAICWLSARKTLFNTPLSMKGLKAMGLACFTWVKRLFHPGETFVPLGWNDCSTRVEHLQPRVAGPRATRGGGRRDTRQTLSPQAPSLLSSRRRKSECELSPPKQGERGEGLLYLQHLHPKKSLPSCIRTGNQRDTTTWRQWRHFRIMLCIEGNSRK